MADFSRLEKRLKKAFTELPEPVVSDAAEGRLRSALLERQSQPGNVDRYAKLESMLGQAFQTMPAPKLDYARAGQRLADKIRERTAPAAALDALSESAVPDLSNDLTQRLFRTIRNAAPEGEETTDRFWEQAWRFAMVLAPCSAAILLISISVQSAPDSPIRILFEESETL